MTRQRLREEEERKLAKARKFQANPLPNLDQAWQPEKKDVQSTVPQPFRLRSLKHREERLKAIREKRLAEEEALKKAKMFRANGVRKDEPFVPSKAVHNPIQPEPFQLATDQRATERQEFDRKAQEKRQKLRQLQEEQAQRHAEQQEQEIKQMRKQAVHKAQPMPNYTVMKVQPSQKLLTEPESPMLGIKKRGHTMRV